MISPAWPQSFRNFCDAVGRTPLCELPVPQGGARIFAKLEWHNPTGSVKDRAAASMLKALLRSTNKSPDHLHILEYSGGNLARSLAVACKALEARCTLFLSGATPPAFIEWLQVQGCEVHLVNPELGFWGVMVAARAFAESHPQCDFLFQHENEANLEVHRLTTGPEIIAALVDRPEPVLLHSLALVGAIGTGATLAGVAHALAPVSRKLHVYGVTPSEMPYGSSAAPNSRPKFGGSGGLGCGRRQRFIAESPVPIQQHVAISYPDSLAAKRLLSDLTGLEVGTSSAAVWLASIKVAMHLGPQDTVVTVLACQGMPHEHHAALCAGSIQRAEELRNQWFPCSPRYAALPNAVTT